MTLKISNALRIISIIILVFVFFIAYAGLPEQVLIFLDGEGNPTQYLDKNYFFYATLAVLTVSNTLIYVLAIMLGKSTVTLNQIIATHLMTLAIVINVFFSVALTFIGILNGQENFDYSSFAPFIYLSQGLFVIWLGIFIFSIFRSKKSA